MRVMAGVAVSLAGLAGTVACLIQRRRRELWLPVGWTIAVLALATTVQCAAWGKFLFPGGAVIGSVLVLNLLAAHVVRFGIQARGARLAAGLLVIAVGALVTWFVIASGHTTEGLQGVPMLDWQTLWSLCKWLLTGLAVLAAGAWAAYVSAVPRRPIESWLTGGRGRTLRRPERLAVVGRRTRVPGRRRHADPVAADSGRLGRTGAAGRLPAGLQTPRRDRPDPRRFGSADAGRMVRQLVRRRRADADPRGRTGELRPGHPRNGAGVHRHGFLGRGPGRRGGAARAAAAELPQRPADPGRGPALRSAGRPVLEELGHRGRPGGQGQSGDGRPRPAVRGQRSRSRQRRRQRCDRHRVGVCHPAGERHRPAAGHVPVQPVLLAGRAGRTGGDRPEHLHRQLAVQADLQALLHRTARRPQG